MGRSVKLVHETEAVCVAACPIGLDEALVEIFDIRRPQAKVLAHMVEIGQVSYDAPDEVPLALRVAPIQCGGCLDSNLLNYPDPSKLLGCYLNCLLSDGRSDIPKAEQSDASVEPNALQADLEVLCVHDTKLLVTLAVLERPIKAAD
jgi:hypothetical protein